MSGGHLRSSTSNAPSAGSADRLLVWIGLVLAVSFAAFVRLRLAELPLERDEGEYAYAGQLILQGVPPYALVYNMKFPGIYYAYAAILAVFGESAAGIHHGLLVVNAATILLLHAFARRILASELAAVAAAGAYAVLSLDRWILGPFAHATHFVALFAVAGFWLVARALASGRALEYVAGGAALGTALLMKQHAVFFLVFAAGIGFVFGGMRPANAAAAAEAAPVTAITAGAGRARFLRAAWVALGGAVPVVIAAAVLSRQGVLEDAWFWTIDYAREYVTRVDGAEGLRNLRSALARITDATRPIWLLAGAGLAALFAASWPRGARAWIGGLLVGSLLAVVPGFFFRSHYFIVLLPAIALLVGVAVEGLRRGLARRLSGALAASVAVAIFVAPLAAYVAKERDYLFVASPEEVSRVRFGSNPFVESVEIARYLEERSSPGDRILVLGSEPQIFFYAYRRSVTGFLYAYPLMEDQRYAERMQTQMIEEVVRNAPRFAVFVAIPSSWLAHRGDEHVILWADRYLGACFDKVGVTERGPDGRSRSVWDAAATDYEPETTTPILIFRRRADGPCEVPS